MNEQNSCPVTETAPTSAHHAGAKESPDAISKRWAQKFQTATAINLSNLGIGKSASVNDLSLPAASSQSIKLSLHLSVSVPNTNFGDRVIVSGSNEALGIWMVDKSPSLYTSPEVFPVWSVDICMVLQRRLMPLEFKFAIVRHGSGFVVSSRIITSIILPYLHASDNLQDWESSIPNRVLWVSTDCVSITNIIFNTALPTWVKQTRPYFPEARALRCKRPSDIIKVDWMCNCPCCNQTRTMA